jgi:hypothetical protein
MIALTQLPYLPFSRSISLCLSDNADVQSISLYFSRHCRWMVKIS